MSPDPPPQYWKSTAAQTGEERLSENCRLALLKSPAEGGWAAGLLASQRSKQRVNNILAAQVEHRHGEAHIACSQAGEHRWVAASGPRLAC